MRTAAGTITQRRLASTGKKPIYSYGYTFFAGRDAEGRRVQVRKSGFQTRGEAATALRDALEGHHARMEAREAPVAAIPEPVKPPTFADAMDAWLQERRTDENVRLRTWESYQKEAQRLLPALGKVEVSAITADVLQAALAGLRVKGNPDKPLSPKTLRNTRGTCYGIFQMAVNRGWITRNPVTGLKRHKPAKRVPKTLTRQQVAQVLQAAAGSDLLPVIALALYCGLRRGEIAGLHWDCVNYDDGEILVRHAVDQTSRGLALKPPKNGNERVVPMGPQLARVLRHHQQQQQAAQIRAAQTVGDAFSNQGLVFPDWHGGLMRPDLLGERVINLCKGIGIRAGMHTFRHQFATDQIDAGTPIADVALWLGHSSPAITLSIYTHSVGRSKAKAIQVMEAKYGVALEGLSGECYPDVTPKPVSDRKDGSSGRTRTYNPSVNSRMLYH